MTSFLFRTSTAPEFPRPRKTYGSMYTDLVRASSDAVDALSLYRTLILAKDTSADGVGFAAFDAHVGDTSCQLRAAMMLDLTRQHRKWAASSGRAPWLDQYIERLEVLRDKGRDMLAKLTIDRIHPDNLGIGPKEDTPTGLLTHMGWCEPEIPRHPNSCYLRSSTPTKAFNDALVLDGKDWDIPPSDEDCVTAWTLTEKSLASSPTQYAWWQIDNNSMHRISPMASCTSLSGDTLAEEVETPQEGSPDKYLSPLLDGQDTAMAWDPWNAKMLVRFITFSFVLSKYKTFHRFKHAVGTRLSPEAAIHAGDEMVHDVWKKRPLDDYLYSKSPRRIYIEFGAMQTWVSELSCAWLCHTAKTSSAAPGLQQLMTRTLQTSVKNVTSIPAYIGYIVIREHCGKEGESLIFVDRHFCKKGKLERKGDQCNKKNVQVLSIRRIPLQLFPRDTGSQSKLR
ncbi:predicted protein [Aspergillus terreus NIH2624]|uniref:Uncharacterized protein n=1 Tax=Aspergillus terreus (strain NIH 2624 / FGSC A1156) TaxID=341663 RepID=Q0CNU5_ASPTN|nr:uncharacterized protein ATEG_04639 [Aspergillus terreus NIH2624]EAU35086.1 predicted protein [Aspergillus terreus NIH2624]